MSRYRYNSIIQQPNSFRYLSSTRYPDIPLSINDSYIVTQYGDRLDILSNQFYGDVSLWWILAAANPDLPKDSLYPPLGYQLRIPTFNTDILRALDELNS